MTVEWIEDVLADYYDCGNEYDCMCDSHQPRDYAAEAKAKYDRTLAALDKAIFAVEGCEPRQRYGPIWWELLTPPPPGLNIREEKDWERYDYRSIGSRAPLLLSSKIYLELPNPPGRANLRWDAGNELSRWPVQSYWVKRDSDTSPVYLTSVLASQPPDFGWWMPSLRNPW